MDAVVGDSLYVDENTPMMVRVLYVDDESKDTAMIAEIFAQFSCEVNVVRFASTASSMLSKGKARYDLLMENVNYPDSYGFKLLQDAAKLELPVILLTYEDNPAFTMRAIEEGAILCVQKPITIELVKYLWQHVLREKILKTKQNEKLNKVHNMQDWGDVKSGKKGWIEWTPELHEKFLDAVRILGEGSCCPKDILELMNVPGLTRMHVASHLQKCRYGDWQINYARKYSLDFNPADTSGPIIDIPPARSRRFGDMPRLENISPVIFNTQEQVNNPVEILPAPNNMREQIYQAPINQQEFNGYFPFGCVDIEHIDCNGHVGFSLDDMFTCDAQSGTSMATFPYQGMGYNGQLQGTSIYDHVDYNSQIPFMLETSTNIWSHEASNSE